MKRVQTVHWVESCVCFCQIRWSVVVHRVGCMDVAIGVQHPFWYHLKHLCIPRSLATWHSHHSTWWGCGGCIWWTPRGRWSQWRGGTWRARGRRWRCTAASSGPQWWGRGRPALAGSQAPDNFLFILCSYQQPDLHHLEYHVDPTVSSIQVDCPANLKQTPIFTILWS